MATDDKDTAAETRAETSTEDHPTETVTNPTRERDSGFVPLIFGGAVAAALGVAGSQLGLIGGNDSQTAELRQQIKTQQDRIAALESRKAPIDSAALDTLRGDVEGRFGMLETSLIEMQKNIASLEARPIFSGNADIDTAAYEKQLITLQQSVQEQRSEIDTLLQNARSVEEATAQTARKAAAQSALARIVSALDTGDSFATPLEDLKNAGVDIPAALSATADKGVSALSNLQSDFPTAARAALAAARSGGESGESSGVGAFLKYQLGARSVTPRDGDDPDAVLSRAEAAVKGGDLGAALTELNTLPSAAQDAMSDWVSRATTRAEARDAATALSQSLTEN